MLALKEGLTVQMQRSGRLPEGMEAESTEPEHWLEVETVDEVKG